MARRKAGSERLETPSAASLEGGAGAAREEAARAARPLGTRPATCRWAAVARGKVGSGRLATGARSSAGPSQQRPQKRLPLLTSWQRQQCCRLQRFAYRITLAATDVTKLRRTRRVGSSCCNVIHISTRNVSVAARNGYTDSVSCRWRALITTTFRFLLTRPHTPTYYYYLARPTRPPPA